MVLIHTNWVGNRKPNHVATASLRQSPWSRTISLSQNVPFAKQRIVLDARASIKLASSLITLAYSLTSFVRSSLTLFDLVIASTLCMKHVL